MKRGHKLSVALPFILVGIFGLSSSGLAQQATTTAAGGVQLTVQVTGIKYNSGHLLIGIFNQEEGFPRDLKKTLVVAKVKPSQPTYTFRSLPPGNYAVVVIHDSNDNGELDTSLLGMPKEPVGISNFQSIGLSNRPTFRKALFSLSDSGLLKVKLNEF